MTVFKELFQENYFLNSYPPDAKKSSPKAAYILVGYCISWFGAFLPEEENDEEDD